MSNYILIAFTTSAIMMLSNTKNQDFQEKYEFTLNRHWWKLTFLSLIVGGALGSICYQSLVLSDRSEIALYFDIFGAVVGYCATQSIYTDFALYEVDRYTLRIGYIITFILSIIYTFNEYFSDQRTTIFILLILSYASILGLFIFVGGVGASDIRAYAILFPFLFLVSVLGIVTFFIMLAYVSIIVGVKQFQAHEKIHVPILPDMFLPYLIIVPLYGFLMNAYEAWQLKG